MKLDAVTLEVLRNALPAVANEMAADLQRTSYNMMIYEVRDYCTALLDTNGELISQNVGGVSHFVADLGVLVVDGMKRYGRDGFKPGDVVITNHQAVAGQHLNNVVIYMPYFYEGELLMSIEHLLPRVIRTLCGETVPCRVDCDNFHEIREEQLRTLAQRVAAEVRRRGRPRTLEPMNPADRRVIHMTLADDPGVMTESEGEGYFKRVSIRPA